MLCSWESNHRPADRNGSLVPGLWLNHLWADSLITGISSDPKACIIFTVHNNMIKVKKRWSICIVPRRENLASKALRCGSHSLTCQHTTPAFTRSSPGDATTEWTVTAPAYYSLIDPVRMKGWVGLVGWPTADVWPTKWSSVQLAVRRRTKKVHRSKTRVLPLCYAASTAK